MTSSKPGASAGNKGKARARLPIWADDPAEDLSNFEGEDGERRLKGESGRTDGHEKEEENGNRDELEELAESILWQAGTDGEDPAGPLLVIACSRIPSPTAVSHPDLLARLRVRLEAFASSGPYSVVLLVNPTPHAPTTPNLVSTYLSLTRTARKNVRRIWVVGVGWWTKVIITLFSTTLLSANSARKLVQASSLNSLADKMGARQFVQIDFPLEVYSLGPEIKLPSSDPPLPRVFGTPLEELTGPDGDRLPALVRNCFEVLLSQGPDSTGIFRRSPSAANVRILKGAYDRGHPVSLASLPYAPYLAASLFKSFLRSLPSPMFSPSSFPLARGCPLADEVALPYIRSRLFPALSSPALLLLQQLCAVLAVISANAKTNLMTSENLVICLCPALIGGIGVSKQEVEMCRVPGMDMGSMRGMRKVNESGRNTLGGVLRVMIDNYVELFDPSALSSLSPTLSLPLVGNEIDLVPTVRALSLPSSPRRSPSSSSRSASVHSNPRSPILSIPEDDSLEPFPPPSSSRSPPQSPSAFQTTGRSSHRGSRASSLNGKGNGESMERSLSISPLSSSASFATAISATSSASSSKRSGTLRLQKAQNGLLLESFASGSGSGAGEILCVGKSATLKKGKSRGIVTVQGVQGVFVQEGARE
ncbi:hypothetical protein JCM11641_007047 [Rhodosporidiobolus odoratus]